MLDAGKSETVTLRDACSGFCAQGRESARSELLELNHGWIIYKKATAYDIINIVAFEKDYKKRITKCKSF